MENVQFNLVTYLLKTCEDVFSDDAVNQTVKTKMYVFFFHPLLFLLTFLFILAGYPHQCTRCHKMYKYKYNLIRHTRYECNKEPQFRCDICSKGFTQKSSLKLHMGVIHSKYLS